MKQLFSLLILLAFLSCKNDVPVDTKLKEISEKSLKNPTNPDQLKLPKACELLDVAKVQEILKAKSAVNLKDADDPTNTSASSCFFKWDDPDTPNAGILIQIQKNPVFNEYDQYISTFVSSKITEGETTLGDAAPKKYKTFNAGGFSGAYSFEHSRFYWNIGSDYLFMLAFNVSTLSEGDMVEIAEVIAAEVNKNFAGTL
ncbi:MAG: hypothetical protein WBO36_11555 [Saprospiraceae bacterium]